MRATSSVGARQLANSDTSCDACSRRRARERVARQAECKHNAIMPNVLVRDVPDDVHAALQHRAERRGQSLQQYLAGELKRLVERPSIDEVLDRIERRSGGSVGLGQAADDVADERATR